MCPGCPYGGLDLSRGLFGFIADLGLGVVSASWVFDDDGSQQPQADLQAAAYTPYTSYSPADSPSTTHWTPTSKYTPATTYYAPETYASYSRFSTATAASSAHSSVSGGSTGSTNSATPSATAAPTVDFDKGTLNQFNMALVGLSGLAEAAAWA
ncbi:hypothetical protein EVJ58_g3875 [Rhodofomes roseus]|uniref:Uncharacterized protein n=1 Tax=Rhodofomes roseus TaxID=34475 RepID=A0A4Y9YLR2_9APHY|nr:hypothetical protein EVJ58_g3875 [Rhodofomes roseus]